MLFVSSWFAAVWIRVLDIRQRAPQPLEKQLRHECSLRSPRQPCTILRPIPCLERLHLVGRHLLNAGEPGGAPLGIFRSGNDVAKILSSHHHELSNPGDVAAAQFENCQMRPRGIPGTVVGRIVTEEAERAALMWLRDITSDDSKDIRARHFRHEVHERYFPPVMAPCTRSLPRRSCCRRPCKWRPEDTDTTDASCRPDCRLRATRGADREQFRIPASARAR